MSTTIFANEQPVFKRQSVNSIFQSNHKTILIIFAMTVLCYIIIEKQFMVSLFGRRLNY